MPSVSKIEKIFLLCVAIFLAGLFLFNKYRDKRLGEDGRFTLGVIEDRTTTKTGRAYSLHYYLNNKKFNLNFSDLQRFDPGQLVFIKVSASNPKLFDILHYLDIKVPSCIRLTDVPVNGWKTIPADTCK